MTTRGLAAMLEKFKGSDFGRCPRVLCDGQTCCPVGTSDVPGVATVKVFCPKCEDVYMPRSDYQQSIDGAYFGTTFVHLLLMTYPTYRPAKVRPAHVPSRPAKVRPAPAPRGKWCRTLTIGGAWNRVPSWDVYRPAKVRLAPTRARAVPPPARAEWRAVPDADNRWCVDIVFL